MSEPWMARGLCHDFADDVEFVPDPFLGQSSFPAKSVCRLCPVIEPCARWRDRNHVMGVAGGEDEADFVVRNGVPEMIDCTACGSVASVVRTGLGSVCTGCGKVDA